MKRKLWILAVLALVLTGCGQTVPAETGETAPMQTTEAADTVVSVGIRKNQLEGKDEQGNLLLSFEYDSAEVSISGREAAAGNINAVLQQEEKSFLQGSEEAEGPSGYGGLLAAAEQWRSEVGKAVFTPYYAGQKFTPVRKDGCVLSLLVGGSVYTGGAHGNNWQTALNFNTESGELLELADLTEDWDRFRETVVRQMAGLAETDPTLQQQIPYVEPGKYAQAFSTLLREGSWYLTENALVFFSADYEFGPYAAGRAEFPIPFEGLKGVLKDRWLG